MTTTNFTYGLTTSVSTDVMGAIGTPDPRNQHVFFDDFDVLVANAWTTTGTGSPTVALSEAEGGLITLTNTTGTTDKMRIQNSTGTFTTLTTQDTLAPHQGRLSKLLCFSAKLQVTAISQGTVIIGLNQSAADPFTSTSEGLFFSKDASGQLTFIARNASTSVATNIFATMANATMILVGFKYDMVSGDITIYCNNVKVDKLSAATLAGKLPATTTKLAPTIGGINTTATPVGIAVDYLHAVKNR